MAVIDGVFAFLCTACIPIGFVALIILPAIFRVVYDYQTGIVLTLGKYSGMRKSGLHIIIPIIQRMNIVDLRIQTVDIPKQEALTKDNVSAFINAVVYFKVDNPEAAVFNIQNLNMGVYQHSQTAIRDVVGSKTLDEILNDRLGVANAISNIVDKEAREWGVNIIGIKMQDIGLPDTMKRAMARQAQAEREKRAAIIVSEGERDASGNLSEAARILNEAPGALHLRTLHMVSTVSGDKTNIMNFVIPIDGVGSLVDMKPAKKR